MFELVGVVPDDVTDGFKDTSLSQQLVQGVRRSTLQRTRHTQMLRTLMGNVTNHRPG